MSFDIHTLTVGQRAVLAVAAFFLGLSKTGLPGAGILAIPFIAAVALRDRPLVSSSGVGMDPDGQKPTPACRPPLRWRGPEKN